MIVGNKQVAFQKMFCYCVTYLFQLRSYIDGERVDAVNLTNGLYTLRFLAYISRASLRISALYSRKSLRFSAFIFLLLWKLEFYSYLCTE